MKTLLLISILIFQVSYSQDQDMEELKVPSSYRKITETKGDLDYDGIDEKVIVYETTEVDKDSFFIKELYICKIEENHIKLWKRNKTVLFSQRDSYDDRDKTPKLKILKNTLIIEQTFHGSSRGDDFFRDVFRFQINDWYLIGSTIVSHYACLWKDTSDINFSTGRVIVTLDNQCCSDVYNCDEDAPDKKFSFKYPFKKILMEGFIPGETELKIPNSERMFTY
jgi:hypothetical protein